MEFFYHWVNRVRDIKERRQWEENQLEEVAENDFAAAIGEDSVYWCWNCKYSDCPQHQNWEYESLSDSDFE